MPRDFFAHATTSEADYLQVAGFRIWRGIIQMTARSWARPIEPPMIGFTCQVSEEAQMRRRLKSLIGERIGMRIPVDESPMARLWAKLNEAERQAMLEEGDLPAWVTKEDLVLEERLHEYLVPRGQSIEDY